MGVNLHPTDKKDPLVPVFQPVKAVSGVAVRFGPTHDPPVPAKGRHGQTVEVGDIQARAEKDQFHVRAVQTVGEADRGLGYRHGHANLEQLTVLQLAGQKHGHDFLGGAAVLGGHRKTPAPLLSEVTFHALSIHTARAGA